MYFKIRFFLFFLQDSYVTFGTICVITKTQKKPFFFLSGSKSAIRTWFYLLQCKAAAMEVTGFIFYQGVVSLT